MRLHTINDLGHSNNAAERKLRRQEHTKTAFNVTACDIIDAPR
jgi:hypothetical protein